MPEKVFETSQPVESQSTSWPKIILAIVLGFTLLAGAAYGGYWYGIRPAKEYCIKAGTGEKLSLAEAKLIAASSECAEGAFKEPRICDETTGTWWIALDIKKEGCYPECVIDVVTKGAKINWRCTGVIRHQE